MSAIRDSIFASYRVVRPDKRLGLSWEPLAGEIATVGRLPRGVSLEHGKVHAQKKSLAV